MSNLSPRVRQFRDALRARREAAEAAANEGRNGGNSPDPFMSDDGLGMPRLTGVPAAPPSGDNDDPFLGPDTHLVGEGHGLHEWLENVTRADYREAAENALRDNRYSVGKTADEIKAEAQALLDEVDSEEMAGECREFIARNADRWVSCDENLTALLRIMVEMYLAPGQVRVEEDGSYNAQTITILNEAGVWKADLIEDAFNELWPNLPELPDTIARPLSEAEARTVMTIASQGGEKVGEAIVWALERMNPAMRDRMENADPSEVIEIMSDPRYRDSVEAAAILAFSACPEAVAAGFVPTEENKAKVLALATQGGRVPTIQLLLASWNQIKNQRRVPQLEEISERARSQAPTQADLDDLSDEEIAALYASVAQAKARGTL